MPTGRAGIGALGLFWDIRIEDHARVVDANLTGGSMADAAVRQLRARGGGTLINIGSVDSEVPIGYQITYAAARAAVAQMLNQVGDVAAGTGRGQPGIAPREGDHGLAHDVSAASA